MRATAISSKTTGKLEVMSTALVPVAMRKYAYLVSCLGGCLDFRLIDCPGHQGYQRQITSINQKNI